jgi:ribosomal protein S18 acetylase RimI-like enzyme
MPSPFTIRACRADEAEALLQLWHDAGLAPSRTDTVEDVHHAIGDSPAVVLVAAAEGRLVGSVIGGFDGWRGNLYRLAVRPEHRRRGIARALVAAVEWRLGERGARRITALVEQHQPVALAFWRAAGYQRDDRMARFVRDL